MPAMMPTDESLAEYIKVAMEGAVFEILGDGTHYAEIPGFQGAWANADTYEDCRREMAEVLEGWIILGIELGHPTPELPGIDLFAKEKIT